MRYIKISNQGELDIRLVALMGGTTKANNKYKIGQFGTGLKYALAWLFRNNVDFRIFVGNNQVNVSIDKEEIKGEVFEIICINGQRTSITTGMGLDWKAWMIMREIWCNALDEGNAVKSIVEENLVGEEGNTVFYIQISSDIQEVLDNWNKHFIPEDTEPIFQNSEFKLYSPGSHMCIYKNGVLVYENPSLKTVFRYDVLDAQINELREYKMSPSYDISRAIKQLNPVGIQHFLDHVTSEHYEGNNMDYNWYTNWGESWQTFMMSTKLLTGNIRQRFSDSGYSYNEHDYTLLPKCLYDSLTKAFDGIGELEVAENKYNFYEVESTETSDKVDSCIERLLQVGYKVHPEIIYTYGFFEDKSTLIRTDRKKLLISIGLSQKTVIEIMKLLMEINEQIIAGIDSTDAIKKHFISLYMRKLIDISGIDLKVESPMADDKKSSLWVAFILTMPNKGSWDGKWSGDGDNHTVIQMITKEKTEQLLGKETTKSWHYSWNDGWDANIEAKVVSTEEERAALLKNNKGFCGYDWMIQSLLIDGTIIPLSERNKALAAPIETEEMVEEPIIDTPPEITDDLPF